MISNGSAKPINRGKAVQLLLNLEQFRGQSAQMGPSVTVKATFGSGFHRAICQAWMNDGVGTYCPLIPRTS